MMTIFDADGEQVVHEPMPDPRLTELSVCWTNDVNTLREIVGAAIEMRRAQKAYFKDRKPSDLQAAKAAERQVDELLKQNGVRL